jgi:GT2 family glycosyltransferase
MGKNQTLLVSVLMSVYNGERELQKTINSILAQTFTEFEFIIVDDGSLIALHQSRQLYRSSHQTFA